MREEIKSQIIGNRAFMFFYGHITVQGLIDAALKLTRNPAFKPGMGVLCDARCASLESFSIQDLIKIGLAAEQNTARRGKGGLSALVVGKRDRWTAEMMATVNHGRLPGNLQIFEDVEEAVRWLEAA
jgi:hypothetical protein